MASCVDGHVAGPGYLVRIPGRAFNAFPSPDGTFVLDDVPPGSYTVAIEMLRVGIPMVGGNDPLHVSVDPPLVTRAATVDLSINNGIAALGDIDMSNPACTPVSCPGTPSCSGNGTCDDVTGACSCAASFSGVACQFGGPNNLGAPGSACASANDCTGTPCLYGFCQAGPGLCVTYDASGGHTIPDGTLCPGVAGLALGSVGYCGNGVCRPSTCVGNDIGVLESAAPGAQVLFTIPCGSKTCTPTNYLGGASCQ